MLIANSIMVFLFVMMAWWNRPSKYISLFQLHYCRLHVCNSFLLWLCLIDPLCINAFVAQDFMSRLLSVSLPENHHWYKSFNWSNYFHLWICRLYCLISRWLLSVVHLHRLSQCLTTLSLSLRLPLDFSTTTTTTTTTTNTTTTTPTTTTSNNNDNSIST